MKKFAWFVLLAAMSAHQALAYDYTSLTPHYCQTASMQVCGTSYTVQSDAIGSLHTINLPDVFKTPSVSVQCVVEGKAPPYYKFLGTNLDCSLKTCSPQLVTLCGASFLVRAESKIGDSVETPVPTELLDTDYATYAPTISAKCLLVNGEPQYSVDDDHGLSCNVFVCRPAKLHICNATVDVKRTAQMGEVIQTVTDHGQPVKVSCMGSEGAPHFVVTDSGCAE